MAQDEDIARIALALRAPGLRYLSFENDPIRVRHVSQTNHAETIPLLNAAPGLEMAGPDPVEESRPTMRLIAEGLSPATPRPAPSAMAANPNWPLLDALGRPTEPPAPPRSTLNQLLAGLAPATAQTSVPQTEARQTAASWLPATQPMPPPPAWQRPAVAPALQPSVLPAERVPGALAEVFQALARGVGAAPAFAGLRLPGGGAR